MPVLIDGHIHIHPAVDLNFLLDQAWQNFTRAGQGVSPDSTDLSPVFLLAEGKENNVFGRLLELARHPDVAGNSSWRFVQTAESRSVLACKGEKKIVVIAGRQLISSEKLELLSLFSPHVFADNTYTLADLARRVTEQGGTPLIAWGVGKWLGKRGRVVEDFINHPPVPRFLVGDNGNRPGFWPYPGLLSQAEQKGIGSLAGSDPLPLASHAGRAGSYGSVLQGVALDLKHPAGQLQQMLSAGASLQPFGRGVGAAQFFRDQLQVNLQKRFGSSKR